MRLLGQSSIAAATLLGLLLAATVSAQTIAPLYSKEVSGGTVSQVAIAQIQFGWLVTAVKNGSGDLEVIVWHDTGSTIVRTGSATAGAITFGLGVTAQIGPDPLLATVVTAAFNSSFNLELISWQVTSSGTITRVGSATSIQGGTSVSINWLSLGEGCENPEDFCVATVTNSSADLTMSVWDITFLSGAITLMSTTSAGAAGSAVISQGLPGPMLGSAYFLTAANVSGNLEMTLWDSASGVVNSEFAGLPTGQLAISNPAAVGDESYDYNVATAISSTGNLEITSWYVNVTPPIEYPLMQAGGTAGAASQVSIVWAPLQGGPFPVTAIRDGKGNLSVEVWHSTSPSILKEYATYNSSLAIESVAITAEFDAYHVVTASRTSANALKINVWLWTP
jgi:hypothetical protein